MSRDVRRVTVFLETLGGGGAERFTQWLFQTIDRSRFEPSLLLLRGKLAYSLPDDVHVDVLNEKPRHLQGPMLNAIAAGIEKQNPDVVLTPLMYAGQLFGRSLALTDKRVRWVARLGAPTPPRRLIHKLGFWRFRRVVTQADVIVQNTRGGADALRNQIPAVASNVVFVPNAVPHGTPNSQVVENRVDDSALPVVIWAGRLAPVKRPDLAIAAAKTAIQRKPFRLKMFGDGPLKQELEQQIKQSGLEEHVMLCGRSESLLDEMSRSDMFLLTSDSEGMPNAMIEAMSVGLPVVATDCRFGPSEWVDQQRGRLARVGDQESVADAISELIADTAMRRSMGVNARDHVMRHCGGNRIIERWYSILTGEGMHTQ